MPGCGFSMIWLFSLIMAIPVHCQHSWVSPDGLHVQVDHGNLGRAHRTFWTMGSKMAGKEEPAFENSVLQRVTDSRRSGHLTQGVASTLIFKSLNRPGGVVPVSNARHQVRPSTAPLRVYENGQGRSSIFSMGQTENLGGIVPILGVDTRHHRPPTPNYGHAGSFPHLGNSDEDDEDEEDTPIIGIKHHKPNKPKPGYGSSPDYYPTTHRPRPRPTHPPRPTYSPYPTYTTQAPSPAPTTEQSLVLGTTPAPPTTFRPPPPTPPTFAPSPPFPPTFAPSPPFPPTFAPPPPFPPTYAPWPTYSPYPTTTQTPTTEQSLVAETTPVPPPTFPPPPPFPPTFAPPPSPTTFAPYPMPSTTEEPSPPSTFAPPPPLPPTFAPPPFPTTNCPPPSPTTTEHQPPPTETTEVPPPTFPQTTEPTENINPATTPIPMPPSPPKPDYGYGKPPPYYPANYNAAPQAPAVFLGRHFSTTYPSHQGALSEETHPQQLGSELFQENPSFLTKQVSQSEGGRSLPMSSLVLLQPGFHISPHFRSSILVPRESLRHQHGPNMYYLLDHSMF